MWTLVLMVAGEKEAVDDGKIKKMRGEPARAVVEYRWMVVDCWLRERD